MEQVFQLLDSYAQLEAGLREYLASELKTIHYKKGEILVKEGSVARSLGFIEKGLIRGYRINEKGNEFTSWFMKEGDVYASVRSFFTQRPATETVEALKPCIIHSLAFRPLQHALRTWPLFHLHRAELLQKYYLQSDEREEMRQQRAYQRVCYLMEHFPGIDKQVKGKYLASFLSLSPNYFSTVKGQYLKKNPRR